MKYRCEYCDMRLSSESALEKHLVDCRWRLAHLKASTEPRPMYYEQNPFVPADRRTFYVKCPRCNMRVHLGEMDGHLKKCPRLVPTQKSEPQNVTFQDFVLCTFRTTCINKNHEVHPVRARFQIAGRNGGISESLVPAFYCVQCRCFFIHEDLYLGLFKSGVPLCLKITQQFYENHAGGLFGEWSGFSDQSKLNMLGYNVNAKDNLSAWQRQRLLTLALESHLYRQHELREYLTRQISLNRGMTGRDMSVAITKWEEDRNFVDHYRTDSAPIVNVKSVFGRHA